MPVYKIKYYYNDVVRCKTLQVMDLQTVRKAARGVFDIPVSYKIHLTWVDEDGDTVHISSAVEFQEFLQYSAATASTNANPDLISCKFGVITELIKKQDEVNVAEMTDQNLGTLDGQRLKAPELDQSKSPTPSQSVSAGCQTSVKNTVSSAPKAQADGLKPATACHDKTRCASCGVSPIIGTRYKCVGRIGYDLCASCEASSDQPFPMLKMVEPRVGNFLRLRGKGFGPVINKMHPPGFIPRSPEPLAGPAVHEGITCIECGAAPITGIRYKCTGRDAYDMCAACEGAKIQPFPTIKIYHSDPTIHVKGWGTAGKICPANPFGFKNFPVPARVKEGAKAKRPHGKQRACSELPKWRRHALKMWLMNQK